MTKAKGEMMKVVLRAFNNKWVANPARKHVPTATRGMSTASNALALLCTTKNKQIESSGIRYASFRFTPY
jgi:hypothetical protein